jgi:hypothetical protein
MEPELEAFAVKNLIVRLLDVRKVNLINVFLMVKAEPEEFVA